VQIFITIIFQANSLPDKSEHPPYQEGNISPPDKEGLGRFAAQDSSLWFMPLSGTQNDEYDT